MNAYDSKHLKTAQLHRLITILSKIWLHKRMKLSLHTTCWAKRRIKSDKQKKKKSSFGRGRKCDKITDLLTWGWEKKEKLSSMASSEDAQPQNMCDLQQLCTVLLFPTALERVHACMSLTGLHFIVDSLLPTSGMWKTIFPHWNVLIWCFGFFELRQFSYFSSQTNGLESQWITGQRQCGEATVILFSDSCEAVVLLCAGSLRRDFVFVLNVLWWSTCLPLSDCVEWFSA